ncbi:MAG: tetratricopeptide repeat protein [Myxococcota bacterium]
MRFRWVWVWVGLIGLGAVVGWVTAPRNAPDRLIRVASQLERGRYRDLAGLGPALTSEEPKDPPNPKVRDRLQGLAAEASARLYADFGHRIEDLEAAQTAMARVVHSGHDEFQLASVLIGRNDDLAGPEDSPKSLIAHALHSVQRGELDPALELLVRALRLSPGRRNTRLELARLQRRLGAGEAAYEVYQGLMADFPDDPVIRFELGVTALRLERIPEPATIPDAHPYEQARLTLLDAVAALRAGRPKLAVKRLRSMPESHHSSAEFMEALADVWLSLGRAFEARQIQTRLDQSEPPEPQDALRMARIRFLSRLARCGGSVRLAHAEFGERRVPLGVVQITEVRFAPFRFAPNRDFFPEDRYDEILRQGLNPKALIRAFSAANRVGLARVCLESNQVSRASRYLERAQRIRADLAAPELLARALIRQNRRKDAQEVLEKVEPGRRTIMQRLLLARLLKDQGEFQRALSLVEPVARSEDVTAPDASRLAISLRIELQEFEGLPDLWRGLEDIDAWILQASWLDALGRTEEAKSLLASKAEGLAEGPISADLPRSGLRLTAWVLFELAPELSVSLLEEAIARDDIESLLVLGRHWVSNPETRRAGQLLLRRFISESDDEEARQEATRLLEP